MVTVVKPTEQLTEDNRVIDGVIVLPEGVTPEEVTELTVGRIMFEETAFSLGQGFNNGAKRKVYFESGRVHDLQAVVEALKLKAGTKLAQYKLIVVESHEPSYDGQQHKIYPDNSPYAGEPVTSGGALVYRDIKMVPASSPQADEYLSTDRRTAEDTPSPAEGIEEAVTEGVSRSEASA